MGLLSSCAASWRNMQTDASLVMNYAGPKRGTRGKQCSELTQDWWNLCFITRFAMICNVTLDMSLHLSVLLTAIWLIRLNCLVWRLHLIIDWLSGSTNSYLYWQKSSEKLKYKEQLHPVTCRSTKLRCSQKSCTTRLLLAPVSFAQSSVSHGFPSLPKYFFQVPWRCIFKSDRSICI